MSRHLVPWLQKQKNEKKVVEMKLEDIGFYTLSNERAQNASPTSPLVRCELILTDQCNFKCLYCRELREDVKGTISFNHAKNVLNEWFKQKLKNVRFSGGEPTLYKSLPKLVQICHDNEVERIAISTNGSANFELYEELKNKGVNDFSISLDGGCCAVGDKMSGRKGYWQKTVSNIKRLSKMTYVTVGMVFTEENVNQCVENVMFADSLGVSDIRVIPAAQYDRALVKLTQLPPKILNKYPILKYRTNNVRIGRHVRGMSDSDAKNCWLALDDMAVAGNFHFPCIIYLRERGNPIGRVGPNMRKERTNWVRKHDCQKDPICKNMCLDVCVDYCNSFEKNSKNKERKW